MKNDSAKLAPFSMRKANQRQNKMLPKNMIFLNSIVNSHYHSITDRSIPNSEFESQLQQNFKLNNNF